MKTPILTVQVQWEQDVVLTRQRARQIAALLEFDTLDQTRIATAVSEMARNAFQYGGGGMVEFGVETAAPPTLTIQIRDRGPGLVEIRELLEQDQRSGAIGGRGITGARRLMDRFELISSPETGTTVSMGKLLPRRRDALKSADLARIGEALAKQSPTSPVEEIQQQNQELLRTLAELRARQAEVERLNAALAAAARRRDEFLAMLAHELRNPLAPISNALQLLRLRGEDTASREQVAGVLERQVSHMSRLLEGLLDISRITQGKIVLRAEALDLVALVSATVEDHRFALHDRDLTLLLDLPAEPVPVQGDATRLSQIVDNLLTNAVKFTEAGGQVAVSLRVDRDRRSVSVTIRDTGIGIEPRMLAHVFDSFTQADHTLDRRRGGLGLGLAVVKGLVEMHAGQVSARSDGLGQGAEFGFTLPWDGASHVPSLALMAPASSILPPLRILVIEDNVDTAETLKELLELSGHEAHVALTGRAGIQAALALRPDVVLCDLGLPEMDGYQVATALRQEPSMSRTCLIAISGYGRAEDQRRCREAGFDSHLVKPVEFEALIQLLGETKTDAAKRCTN